MARTQGRKDPLIEKIVDIMERSLSKFSAEEQETPADPLGTSGIQDSPFFS